MIRLSKLLVLNNAGLSGITLRPAAKYIQYKITVIANMAVLFVFRSVQYSVKETVYPPAVNIQAVRISLIYMFIPVICVALDG